MDSTRETPSLLDRWWSIRRPHTVADVAAALALFLAEGLVYFVATFFISFTLTPRTPAQSAQVSSDLHLWTVGVALASVAIFLGAVVRRAAVTAGVHFVVAMGVILVLLSPRPAAAPAGPSSVPSYYDPCYSGQHCS